MKKYGVLLLRSILVFMGTVGIIVPVAVLYRPAQGYRMPMMVDSAVVGEYQRPIRQQLSLLVRGVAEMEQNKQVDLQPVQARRMLAVVAPWRKRPHINEEQAAELCARLDLIFTDHQKSWMRDFMAQYPPYGGGMSSGYGEWDRMALEAFRRTYNPLCVPDAAPRFKHLPAEVRQRYQDRYNQRQAILEQLGRKAKSPTSARVYQ